MSQTNAPSHFHKDRSVLDDHTFDSRQMFDQRASPCGQRFEFVMHCRLEPLLGVENPVEQMDDDPHAIGMLDCLTLLRIA